MPDTLLGPCDSLVNETDKVLCPQGAYVLAVGWRCSYDKHNKWGNTCLKVTMF